MVQPIKKINGEVRLPGSKSLSNRALLLAALSEGITVVENLLVRSSHTASSQSIAFGDIRVDRCAFEVLSQQCAPHASFQMLHLR